MTTHPPAHVVEAPYDGLTALLPKLARPSWVWQIGEALRKNETLAALQADALDKRAQKKAAKKRYSAYRKLHDAIRGVA